MKVLVGALELSAIHGKTNNVLAPCSVLSVQRTMARQIHMKYSSANLDKLREIESLFRDG